MERYYTSIDKKYEEFEYQLEALEYEYELMMAFGPAVEADSTIAIAGSGGGPSVGEQGLFSSESDGSKNNKAANSLGQAAQNVTDDDGNQNKDNQTTKNQSDGKDNTKSKSQLLGYVKEVMEKLREFIRNAIVECKTSMSDMLNDNADTLKELNSIMAGKTPNYGFSFKDFVYDDNFLGKFGEALSKVTNEYFSQIQELSDKINKLKDALASGNADERDAAIKAFGIMDSKQFNELPEEEKSKVQGTTTSSSSGQGIYTPAQLLGKALGVNVEKGYSSGELKKYVYNKFKGIDQKNNGPKTMNLSNHREMLQQAVDYVKTRYRDYLKIANDSVDGLKKDAEAYEKLCDKIVSLSSVDERIRVQLTNIVNIIARDINTIAALMEYFRTMVKERGLSAASLIKGAYGARLTNPEVDNNGNYIKKGKTNEKSNNTKQTETEPPKEQPKSNPKVKRSKEVKVADFDRYEQDNGFLSQTDNFIQRQIKKRAGRRG